MAQPNDVNIQPMAPPAHPIAVLVPKPLVNNRLKLICSSASDIGNHWAAVLPIGVSFSAALQPEFWSNLSTQLRIGDVIDIHGDARDFFGRVYVRDTGRTRASVAKLEYHEFDALAPAGDPSSHRVKYSGPHTKWGIERIADGKLVKDNLDSKEAAEVALKGMERANVKVA
jgi:hypothetical protein